MNYLPSLVVSEEDDDDDEEEGGESRKRYKWMLKTDELPPKGVRAQTYSVEATIALYQCAQQFR